MISVFISDKEIGISDSNMINAIFPVSYTHLDVYKRQAW